MVCVVNKNMLQKQAAVWCVPALRVPLVHSQINHFRQKTGFSLYITRCNSNTNDTRKLAGQGRQGVLGLDFSRALSVSRSRLAEVVVAVAHAPVQVDAPPRESKHGWKWSSRQEHEPPYAAADSSGSRDGRTRNVLTLAARRPRPAGSRSGPA